jgi:translation initiation factor 3 subunit M
MLCALPHRPSSLSNLFNAIPRQSSLRFFVYKTLLEIAIANDQLDFLQLSNPQVEKWISEWSVSPGEKSDFLKLLVDVYTKAGYPYDPSLVG